MDVVMHSPRFLFFILVVCFWSASLSGELKSNPVNGPAFVEVTDARGYKALVLVPVNTSEAINGKLPAILFLHGIGESGNDLNRLKQNGFPRILEGDQQFPFVFIMPQCPSSTEWYYTNADNITAMRTFLDDILSRFPIDADRLSITGLSMGGIGSWYFAITMAKDIPVWAFHGANDGVIPLSKAQELVDQFRAAGGNIKFDPYPNGGHDASTWTVTYNNPDVYDWMLRKKRLTYAAPSDDSRILVPQGVSLDQNFPNPFNPATAIRFGLPEVSSVTLKIYDVAGREVATLINDQLTAGYHEYTWNAGGAASGAYLYRIDATASNGNGRYSFRQAKKLLLQK
jgi:predicted esterase